MKKVSNKSSAISKTAIRKKIIKMEAEVNAFYEAGISNRSHVNTVIDKIKKDIDSMSELGETESLRLQMAMNRLSKLMSTLSNILKKISDTSNSIVQNLK